MRVRHNNTVWVLRWDFCSYASLQVHSLCEFISSNFACFWVTQTMQIMEIYAVQVYARLRVIHNCAVWVLRSDFCSYASLQVHILCEFNTSNSASLWVMQTMQIMEIYAVQIYAVQVYARLQVIHNCAVWFLRWDFCSNASLQVDSLCEFINTNFASLWVMQTMEIMEIYAVQVYARLRVIHNRAVWVLRSVMRICKFTDYASLTMQIFWVYELCKLCEFKTAIFS